MPAGNDQLISNEWQPVAGAPGASIFPVIRKIDMISSNSYLITTPDVILLIDPGGSTDQAVQLHQMIANCREERDRPVFVLLTHAHVDHFVGAQHLPAFAYPESIVFSVQEEGAEALERCDERLSQAAMLGVTQIPMKPGFRLLTRERGEYQGVPVALSFSNGAEVTVVRDRVPTGPGQETDRERISFGAGPGIEIYHTPGHSPDSICIRIGELLFIGDVLFAANPGVAGVCGWSQADLVRSLSAIIAIIRENPVRHVFPGHGKALPAEDAVRVLSSVVREACTLKDIAEVSPEWAKETAAYAEDCMDEVNEIFTIIAGRLYYISYVMDELGEAEIAERLASQYDAGAVDELLNAFKEFAEEHHRRENNSIHLALKAGQVISRMDRAFRRDELARLVDPTMVQRAGRLLSDYTTMLRGYYPPCDLAACDVTEQIRALVTGLSVSVNSDDDVLASADDDAAFVQMLLARVGARPLLEDVDLVLATGDGAVHVVVDREHFSDLLTYILEDLVGTGSSKIVISTGAAASQVTVTVAGDIPAHEPADGKRKTWNFLERLGFRAGGSLVAGSEGGMRRFTMTLNRA